MTLIGMHSERPEEGKEDREERFEVEEDGNAAINMVTPPSNENNDSPDLGTSPTKHISFAMDIVPKSLHE